MSELWRDLYLSVYRIPFYQLGSIESGCEVAPPAQMLHPSCYAAYNLGSVRGTRRIAEMEGREDAYSQSEERMLG